MKEGISSSAELGMSERAINALLAYLYYWEIKEAAEFPSVAFELLVASDKYDIARLRQSMTELIMAKENEWFPVGVAFKLLQFARCKQSERVDRHYWALQKRAADVLRE